MVTQGASVDLFGERRIQIAGNPKLEGICNHILDATARHPDLLNGDTVGDINRKVTHALWCDNGLLEVIASGNNDLFKQWYFDKKRCYLEEEVARGVRWLSEHDEIRLPKLAIEKAVLQQQRIARSLHH